MKTIHYCILIMILIFIVGVGFKEGFFYIPSRQFTITPKETIKIEIELIGWREVTGYSSTIEQCDDTPFITASGERVRHGTIACPWYFPFGTKVLIEDIIYTCEDRMNSRYVHRFDIWFPDEESAIEFGKQILEVKKVELILY